jgi:phage terminase small subunit
MPILTPKQRLFVVEYLKDLNATQAAVRAGLAKKPLDHRASGC